MPVWRIEDLSDRRLEIFRDLKQSNPLRHSGRFIAEGRFVVERLIHSDFEVQSLLLTNERFASLQAQLPVDTADVFVVPRRLIRPLVGFDFHAGVLACGLRKPNRNWQDVLPPADQPLTVVVCWRTSDPENLGQMIRLCRAFGVHALVLGRGCADAYSRRVLRVSMGNGFALPILEDVDGAEMLQILRRQHRVASAAMTLSSAAIPLCQVHLPRRLAIVFGHESQGLPQEVAELCDQQWTIPMSAGTDSLNVACSAAIVLHTIHRANRSAGH